MDVLLFEWLDYLDEATTEMEYRLSLQTLAVGSLAFGLSLLAIGWAVETIKKLAGPSRARAGRADDDWAFGAGCLPGLDAGRGFRPLTPRATDAGRPGVRGS